MSESVIRGRRKRFLSLLIAAVMLFGMLQVQARAADYQSKDLQVGDVLQGGDIVRVSTGEGVFFLENLVYLDRNIPLEETDESAVQGSTGNDEDGYKFDVRDGGWIIDSYFEYSAGVGSALLYPAYVVSLSGGANAAPDDSSKLLQGLEVVDTPEMATVTYTANTGYQFPAESEYYTTTNGITVERTSDTVITVSGKPTGDATLTIPDALAPIVYSVEADNGVATVNVSSPEQRTYTAELTGLPSDKTYDGWPVNLTATVQKSEGFPAQVPIGEIVFKDQNNNAVTTARNVGTYTASVTVGDKTISKTYRINGQTPVTYETITQSGSNYLISSVTTDQYIPLKSMPDGIAILLDGCTYVARGNIEIGAMIFVGDVKLILCGNTRLTVYAGIYHIGSNLEIYKEKDAENAVIDVMGNKMLSALDRSALDNYPDLESTNIVGSGASLSGAIRINGGTLNVAKGNHDDLVADDIRLTIGAALAAKGKMGNSEPAYLTGGSKNNDGSVTYNKSNLSLTALSTESKPSATVSDVPTAKTLTYTGSAQQLVNAGTAEGGTMRYALGSDATNAPAEEWYTEIPEKTDAGTYYVWYMVIGDNNHNNSKPESIETAISRASISPTVSLEGWTYGEDARTPGVEGNTGNGAVTYTYKAKDAEDTTYSATVPTDAGEYTVRAEIAETANYNAGVATANFTVGRKAATVTAQPIRR